MKKIKIQVFLLLSIVLVLAACGRPSGGSSSEDGDEKYKINIAYLVSEEQSTHLAAVDFKEQLEKESDGRLQVELHPNGSLYGSDREAIEAVQLGNVEMTIPALAAVSSFNQNFMVFDLPFLFDDKEAAYRTLDGEVGQELLAELDDKGLKGLAYAENGFRHITNNKGPVEKPEDLKGLKLRTMESPLQTDSFKEYGANASPFAFGELYTALQQGTYDAMENPISLIYTNKFYEVQNYLTLSNHFYAPTILAMNKDFFDGLPEDLQVLVEKASEDYRDSQRKLATEQDAEWIELIKEEGMQVNELTEEQLEVFKEASEPIYEKYRDKIGGDLMDRAIESSKN